MSLVRFRSKAFILYGILAQVVEHLTFNQVVPGSSPGCLISVKRLKVLIYKALSLFLICELPLGYRDEIFDIIDNANTTVKNIVSRNIDKITFANYKILGIRFCNNKGIFVNLSKDSNNKVGKFKTMFHEMGHQIDRLESFTDNSKYFEQALYNDFHNLEKSVII